MTPLLAKTLALTTLTVVVGPTTFTPPRRVLIRPILSPPRVGTSPVATSLAKTVAPVIKFIQNFENSWVAFETPVRKYFANTIQDGQSA